MQTWSLLPVLMMPGFFFFLMGLGEVDVDVDVTVAVAVTVAAEGECPLEECWGLGSLRFCATRAFSADPGSNAGTRRGKRVIRPWVVIQKMTPPPPSALKSSGLSRNSSHYMK